MATKEQLMTSLRNERDRIADEIDGVGLALQAGCNLPLLLSLLVPGLGVAVYVTARAACATDSVEGLRRRVAIGESVIEQLETMALAVDAADPASSTWPTVERSVRDLVAASSRVRLLADGVDAAKGVVDEVFAYIRRLPEVIPEVGFGLGAAALGVAVLLLLLRR